MRSRGPGRRQANPTVLLAALALALGYLEAVATLYARALAGPRTLTPGPPPVTVVQLPDWLLASEQSRVALLLLVLVAVALLVAGRPLRKLAALALLAGALGLGHYVSLKILTDWPTSWQDPEYLPLAAPSVSFPVWVPFALSSGLAVLGWLLLRRIRE